MIKLYIIFELSYKITISCNKNNDKNFGAMPCWF